MAWVTMTNNTGYQYNNAPADPGANSPHRTLWQQQTGGVRTHTATGHKVYTNVRKVSTTTDIGEMSKTFWDAQ